jgi:hypothetical protein
VTKDGHGVHVRSRSAGPALADLARRTHADVVYVDTNGHGTLDPVSVYLLAHRPCRVIVETSPVSLAAA